MGKLCRAGQATDDNIIWRTYVVLCITKATNVYSECVMLLAFYVCRVPGESLLSIAASMCMCMLFAKGRLYASGTRCGVVV